MPVFLILLFGFQSALAFAFSLFITRLLLSGAEAGHAAATARTLRRLLLAGAAFAIVVPLLVLGAFLASLPEGESPDIALWPSIWVAMILGGGWLGMWIAARKWRLQHP